MSVRLEVERIWFVVGWVVSWTRWRDDKRRRTRVARGEGGVGKSAREGRRRRVFLSSLRAVRGAYSVQKPVETAHLGNRCRGHGTIPNSCGQERRKLNICGMKNRRTVFEKWPSMPATAMVMPAK